MTQAPNVPTLVKERPEGLIDCADITDALIYPKQDRQPLYDQVRGLLTAGYLWPVAREARNKKAFLMTPDNLLIADVLLRLREMGIPSPKTGSDPYHATNLRLRNWTDDKPDGAAPSPAAHVIAEYEVGAEGWVFELHHFLHVQTGRVHFEARIHNVSRMQATGLRAGVAPQWEPRGCYAVDLTDALDRIHPRGKAAREALN